MTKFKFHSLTFLMLSFYFSNFVRLLGTREEIIMGKVSPKEKGWKVKVRSSGKNKYLRPGALAQLRCSKPSSGSSGGGASKCCCTDLGKKRVAFFHTRKSGCGCGGGGGGGSAHGYYGEKNTRVFYKSPLMLSPVNLVKHNGGFFGTPKTPRLDDSLSESSKLESLPMDLLVC